jgi:hypothetical protein
MPRSRYHVDPRAVPVSAVARRLGVTETVFNSKLPELIAKHGFPHPLPVFGTFDLVALDRWIERQNSPLFSDTAAGATAVNAGLIDIDARLARLKAPEPMTNA